MFCICWKCFCLLGKAISCLVPPNQLLGRLVPRLLILVLIIKNIIKMFKIVLNPLSLMLLLLLLLNWFKILLDSFLLMIFYKKNIQMISTSLNNWMVWDFQLIKKLKGRTWKTCSKFQTFGSLMDP